MQIRHLGQKTDNLIFSEENNKNNRLLLTFSFLFIFTFVLYSYLKRSMHNNLKQERLKQDTVSKTRSKHIKGSKEHY